MPKVNMLKITSRGQMLLNGKCNFLLIFYHRVSSCVCSLSSVLSARGGLAQSHRTIQPSEHGLPSSGQKCESVRKSENMLAALRKSSLQLSAAHSACAAPNESRVSHTALVTVMIQLLEDESERSRYFANKRCR